MYYNFFQCNYSKYSILMKLHAALVCASKYFQVASYLHFILCLDYFILDVFQLPQTYELLVEMVWFSKSYSTGPSVLI